MLYNRVISPFLPDTDYSDYLVDQLQDIADVCSTSIPNITTRAVITWDSASAPTWGLPTSTTTTVAPPASTTCAGQTLGSATGCDALALKYGLTTGDLQAISGSDVCAISSPLCFPASCTLRKTGAGDTWYA